MKNETIQVDGKFYIRSKVVMLPTEKEKQIGQLEYFEQYKTLQIYTGGSSIGKPQHLYFLSEEEIKEGDLVFSDMKDYYNIHHIVNQDGVNATKHPQFKKIIATTDESLIETVSEDEMEGKMLSRFPRPSNEFLQAYCKANGKIDEVLIECEANFTPDVDTSKVCGRDNWRLKVSPDNTVTIKKLERKLYLTQEEIDKRVNMHDELIHTGKLLADFANKILQYPKGSKGYDPADAINLNNQIEKMDQIIKQSKDK